MEKFKIIDNQRDYYLYSYDNLHEFQSTQPKQSYYAGTLFELTNNKLNQKRLPFDWKQVNAYLINKGNPYIVVSKEEVEVL